MDCVLLPCRNGRRTDRLVDLAFDIAAFDRRTLILLLAARGPHQTPTDHPDLVTEERRDVAKHILRVSTRRTDDLQVRGVVRVGRDRSAIVRRFVEEYGIETLLVDANEVENRLSEIISLHPQNPVHSVECDVVTASGIESLDQITSILVPTSPGPYSGLAIEIASAVASQNGAWIDLLHIIGEDAVSSERRRARALLSIGMDTLDNAAKADTWILEAADVAEAIIEQSRYYDITVIGGSPNGWLKQLVFGSTSAAVRRSAHGAVLTAYRPEGDRSWMDQ